VGAVEKRSGVGVEQEKTVGVGSSTSARMSSQGRDKHLSLHPLTRRFSISSFGVIAALSGAGRGGSKRGRSKPKSDKSSSSSPAKGSSSSNAGGATKQGSGVTPNYGGGRYYGGGASVPYTAGSRSPLGLVAVPLAFGAGALAFYPGFWPYGKS